ncbi:MAG: hypothetical protein ACRD0P_06495, partial [Stackebrandtia sp.]
QDRCNGLVDDVTLAAAYHSARAATPLHPRRQVVDARHAALYRPVREEVWSQRRLRPAPPDWMDSDDSFGEAAESLHRNGTRVSAWIVLTHATRLGRAFNDIAVINCFGESYPYALCPAHGEVREYAATLAAESLREAPVDAVSLEACGQLGIGHLGHHDKTAGAWSHDAARWLSVCCCRACETAWRANGLDPEAVKRELRTAVRGEALGEPRAPAPDLEKVLLAVRQESVDLLRAEVLAAVRRVLPKAPITLHASPDPWATGPSPGLTPTTVADVDALLVPAWSTTPATAETVSAAVTTGAVVDAYVTVLPPVEVDELPAHLARLLAAGVRGLNLYHLGLAPAARLRLLAELLAAL